MASSVKKQHFLAPFSKTFESSYIKNKKSRSASWQICSFLFVLKLFQIIL